MTDLDRKNIRATVNSIIGCIGKWGAGKVMAAHQASLIHQGLVDINRLADAAEALLPKTTARPTADNAGIKTAVDALAERAVKSERQIIDNYVGWMMTRPGVVKFGAAYEVPAAIETVDEYLALRNGGA